MSDSDTKQSSTGSGRRIHFAKNNNKKIMASSAAPSSDSNTVEKELYGFHPLRSLRNIFFGYRSKERPLSASSAYKARSTENLTALSSSRKFDDSDSDSGVEVASTTVTPVATVTQLLSPTKPAKEQTAYDRRRSMPYNQMLSISADDLLETIGWSASVSNSTEQRLSSHANSVKKIPEDIVTMSPRTTTNDDVSSRDKEHQHQQPVLIISSSSAEEAEDFFEEKWSSRDETRMRQRAISETLEGAMRRVDEFTTDDLDVVDSGHNLDVSVIKNKLAVKQKGKRATALLQQKMAAATDHSARIEGGPRSLNRAVSETGEPNLNREYDRHSIDSLQLGTSSGERLSLLNGTDSIREATKSNDGANELQLKVDRATEDRLQTTAAATDGTTATPALKHIFGPAHCTGQKMLVSNEQLTEALRRSGTPRTQHLDSPGGKTGVPPSTPPKSLKSAREGGTIATSVAPSATVTPKSCAHNKAEEGKGVACRTPSSGKSEIPPRLANDCKNQTGAAVVGELVPVAKKDESAVERQPLKLSNSATGVPTTQSTTASSVEASTISSAAKNLKARPKTMAPVYGAVSTEPAWMAELAAKKKTRDATSNETNEMTNL